MPREVPRSRRVARLALALLCVAASTRAAGAQIIRVPADAGAPEPRLWVSGSLALLQAQDVPDGRTGSYWQFGGRMSPQYRGSVELAIARGTTVGIAGTHARQRLRYYQLANAEPGTPAAACDGCYASVDVRSLMLTGRAGGGPGLHQVIEIAAGIVQYGGFERRDGSALPPTRDRDLAGSIGYGGGYTVSRSLQISLVQDLGIALHQKDALPRNAGRTSQQQTTRLSVRYGLGGRR